MRTILSEKVRQVAASQSQHFIRSQVKRVTLASSLAWMALEVQLLNAQDLCRSSYGACTPSATGSGPEAAEVGLSFVMKVARKYNAFAGWRLGGRNGEGMLLCHESCLASCLQAIWFNVPTIFTVVAFDSR